MKSNLLNRKSVIRVKEFLIKYDNNINLITLNESARTAKDAAKALKKEVGAIVKSLLFKNLNNDFFLCLVSGDKYISIKKLSSLIDSKIIKANADQCKKITGFSIGGVSPVAHINPINKILIDKNLARFKMIYAAAGHPYVVFGINFYDLCKLTNGEVGYFIE